MDKSKLILILAATSLLAGCDNRGSGSSSVSSSEATSSSSSASSSSSSSSVDDGTITFENMYKEIAKTQAAEINGAKTTTYRNESSSSVLSNVTEETYTSYADGSTTSTGTYIKTEEGKDPVTDTFKRIATKETDTYLNDDKETTTSYDMFVEVTDFAGNKGTTETYQDSASKKFIIDSEDSKGNLEDDQYILKSDFALYASANLTSKLASIISDLAGSLYIPQLGKTGIKPVTMSDGNVQYKDQYKYSYVEDGQNIVTTIDINYILDSTKTKLMSFDYSNSVTYTNSSDATDTYTSKIAQSGNITYGDKVEKMGNDVLNPNEYFLTDVLFVGLEAKTGFNVVDFGGDDEISLSTAYTDIYGYAASKKPSKALKTYLAASASSNEEVVAIEDGNFVIKGLGTVDLTFSYYRKRPSDGVYYQTTVKYKGLTIEDVAATSVSFNQLADYHEYGLVAGAPTTWSYSVAPSKASQLVTATSSDSSILEVSVSKEGTLSLNPKKEGEVTITIASVRSPEVTATKKFYVLDSNTDYVLFLTSNKFYCNRRIYGYDMYLTFKADGTGTCTTYTKDSDYTTAKNTTFDWDLDGTYIEFDEFDANLQQLSAAQIVKYIDKDGQPFGFSADGDGYATLEFVVVNN